MNIKKQADYVWEQRNYLQSRLEVSQSTVSMSMLLSNVFFTSSIHTAVAFRFRISAMLHVLLTVQICKEASLKMTKWSHLNSEQSMYQPPLYAAKHGKRKRAIHFNQSTDFSQVSVFPPHLTS